MVKQKRAPKDNGSKSTSKNASSFGKFILNGFKNTLSGLPMMYTSIGNTTKKRTLITPTAIGGSEQQAAFLKRISDASDEERVDLIYQLKRSIEEKSVSSIMESWIPVSGIFNQIKGEMTETAVALRQALTDLLYTCIIRDDLSQEGIVLRYLYDILVYCEISSDNYDPCLRTFLKCLYKLIENDLLVEPFLIEFSVQADDIGDSKMDLSSELSLHDQTTSIKYSLENFILNILSCNALLTTMEGISIIEIFVNKLTMYTEVGTFTFLDLKLIQTIIKLLFSISLELENIQSFEYVLINILSFVKAILLNSNMPISSLPLIMIMLFHLYSEGTSYQHIIEFLFSILIENESTCDICYEIMLEFIQTVNINDYLNFKEYDLNNARKKTELDDYPTEVVSLKGTRLVSDKLHYKSRYYNSTSELSHENQKTNDSINLEILYRLTKEPFFPKRRKIISHDDPIDVSTQILFGILNLLCYIISKDNFKILRAVEKKEFIFDISSYKFQALINALFNRIKLQSNYNNSKPDVNILLKSLLKSSPVECFENSVEVCQEISKLSQISVYRIVLYFIFFLLKTKVIFMNIPEHLFFYQKNEQELLLAEDLENAEFPLTDPILNEILLQIETSQISDDIENYTILDILDDIYNYFFVGDIALEMNYPHLFKDELLYKENMNMISASYQNRAASILTSDETLLFDILEIYHLVLDYFQLYSDDSVATVKLSLMDTPEYLLNKANMLNFSNWKYVFRRFSKGSTLTTEENAYIKSIQSKIFAKPELQKLVGLLSLSENDIIDLKILSLNSFFNFLTNHFDFTSGGEGEDNDNNYWMLLSYLFGTNGDPNNNYFKLQTDLKVTAFLCDCFGNLLCLMSVADSKKLIYDYLFEDIFKQDVYKCAKISPKVLQQITQKLTDLFVRSCINNDKSVESNDLKIFSICYINDRREKVLFFYESLVAISKLCLKYFGDSNKDDIYYDDMFRLFFFVIDFFSRIRSTKDGFLYFDNRKREFKILFGENKKGGSGDEVNYLIQRTEEYLENNQPIISEELALKPSAFVKVLDGFQINNNTELVQIDVNEILDFSVDLINGKYGFKFTLLSWYLLILQLANIPLFINSIQKIKLFTTTAVQLMQNNMTDLSFYKREPSSTSITVRDTVTLQRSLIRLVIRLLMYSKYFSRDEQTQLVLSISSNLDNFENLGILSIHALSVCCYQIPHATTKYIQSIIFKLQQHISNMDAVPHILEFLLTISHLPELTKNFGIEDFKSIFGMSFRFIQSSKDIQNASNSSNDENSLKIPLSDSERLSNYYSSLSFSIVSSWFIEMNMCNRKKLAPYIIKCLLDLSDEKNKNVDARCAVLVDFIQRFTFTNVDLRFKLIKEVLPKDSEIIDLGRWILGISIISVLTNRRNGISIVNIRRPTGTTKFELKPHHSMVPLQNISEYSNIGCADDGLFTASYIFLQILAHIFTDTDRTPMKIPPGKEFSRSVELFDKKPLVEVYKAGLIYIAPGQTTEKEVLLNNVGSRSYQNFLSRIGDLIYLKNNTTYYNAGLNPDTDGEFAYCWDSKIFQLTFHTTTLMPSTNDVSLTLKKRHIGNDFVNIYFDESGKPFNFNIIPSQFTFVNIVISPVSIKEKKYSSLFNNSDLYFLLKDINGKDEKVYDSLDINSINYDNDVEDDEFFQIHTYLKPGLPEVFSTCRTKTISSKNLPFFIRTLAVIANQFAEIWNSDNPVNENIWSDRYFAILQLKRRVQKFYEESNTDSNRNATNNIPNNLKTKASDNDSKGNLTKILDFTGYT